MSNTKADISDLAFRAMKAKIGDAWMASEYPHLVITHAQMESLLKSIPPGWELTFKRPLLRPDIIEFKVIRSDGMALGMKTTGAMLLENKDRNFLHEITRAVNELKSAKKEGKKQ